MGTLFFEINAFQPLLGVDILLHQRMRDRLWISPEPGIYGSDLCAITVSNANCKRTIAQSLGEEDWNGECLIRTMCMKACNDGRGEDRLCVSHRRLVSTQHARVERGSPKCRQQLAVRTRAVQVIAWLQ